MSRIILHSDDFGLHPAVNRAILEAADRGVLTSASLMANGAAFDEAAASACKYPALGIGVHLNIVRGFPLSDPSEVPSLVDEEGRFLNSMARLMARSSMGRLNGREVLVEYRRQVRRIIDNGISPTHFDSEKHSHVLLPEATRAVADLAAEFGVGRVRSIRERALLGQLRALGLVVGGGFGQRLKLILLEFRARRAERLWAGISRPRGSFGVTVSGGVDTSCLTAVLEAMLSDSEDGVVEWMFHLGYPFDEQEAAFRGEFGRFFLGGSRYAEARFLLSAEVARLVARNRHRFGSYRVL